MTLFDVWRREAEQYLALSPEQRAEQDKQNRITHLEADKQRAREGKVRAAALRKLMENEELRARMPAGTTTVQ